MMRSNLIGILFVIGCLQNILTTSSQKKDQLPFSNENTVEGAKILNRFENGLINPFAKKIKQYVKDLQSSYCSEWKKNGSVIDDKTRLIPINFAGANFKIYCHGATKDIVSESIIKDKSGDADLTKKILIALQNLKNGVFIDVGANIGGFSILFGSLGYEVYAYEPFNKNVALLRKSICANNLENKISLFPVGLD